MPRACVWGKNLTVEHAFTCPTGGMPTLRHNNLRDLTADLMSEVCPNVCTEPELQPLSGEVRTARRISQTPRWSKSGHQRGGVLGEIPGCIFLMWGSLTHLHPQTVPRASLPFTSTNRRSYNQRICEVEHDSFIPLVFAATGGIEKAAHVTYQRLVSMLAVKRDQSYSQLMNTIRCLISFSLLKLQIRCIRGSRSTAGHAIKIPINVIASEGCPLHLNSNDFQLHLDYWIYFRRYYSLSFVLYWWCVLIR